MADESHIAQLSRQAEACLNKGDLAQARRLYAEICRARDDDAQAWLMYGVINGELGNAEIARNSLERAVALDPANAEAHLAQAHLLKAAQKPAEALAAAQRAVEADAGFVDGWLFVAGLAGQQSDWPRAEEACNKAIALAPERPEAYVNLGNVRLTTGRLSEAEASFRRALALGETAEAWFGYGAALGAQGRHPEAETALATALRLNPGSVEFRQALASCRNRLGESGESAAPGPGARSA